MKTIANKPINSNRYIVVISRRILFFKKKQTINMIAPNEERLKKAINMFRPKWKIEEIKELKPYELGEKVEWRKTENVGGKK